LYVRNVPADLYADLRALAEQDGRSLNAEAIAVLRTAVESRRDRERLLEDLRELRKSVSWPAEGPTAEQIIRDARDSR